MVRNHDSKIVSFKLLKKFCPYVFVINDFFYSLRNLVRTLLENIGWLKTFGIPLRLYDFTLIKTPNVYIKDKLKSFLFLQMFP